MLKGEESLTYWEIAKNSVWADKAHQSEFRPHQTLRRQQDLDSQMQMAKTRSQRMTRSFPSLSIYYGTLNTRRPILGIGSLRYRYRKLNNGGFV